MLRRRSGVDTPPSALGSRETSCTRSSKSRILGWPMRRLKVSRGNRESGRSSASQSVRSHLAAAPIPSSLTSRGPQHGLWSPRHEVHHGRHVSLQPPSASAVADGVVSRGDQSAVVMHITVLARVYRARKTRRKAHQYYRDGVLTWGRTFPRGGASRGVVAVRAQSSAIER
jgi:hypothetical protein